MPIKVIYDSSTGKWEMVEPRMAGKKLDILSIKQAIARDFELMVKEQELLPSFAGAKVPGDPIFDVSCHKCKIEKIKNGDPILPRDPDACAVICHLYAGHISLPDAYRLPLIIPLKEDPDFAVLLLSYIVCVFLCNDMAPLYHVDDLVIEDLFQYARPKENKGFLLPDNIKCSLDYFIDIFNYDIEKVPAEFSSVIDLDYLKELLEVGRNCKTTASFIMFARDIMDFFNRVTIATCSAAFVHDRELGEFAARFLSMILDILVYCLGDSFFDTGDARISLLDALTTMYGVGEPKGQYSRLFGHTI